MRAAEAVLHIADFNEATRDRALAALLADKPAAIVALTAAVRGGLPEKRFVQAARLLAAFGGTVGAPALLDALDKGTLSVDERAAAANALRDLVDDNLARDPRLRRHAHALSRELLSSMRRAAIALLTAIDDDEARGRLRAMAAADSDLAVRQAAADAVALLDAAKASSAPPSAAVPEGGMAFDFEAMVAGGGAPSSPMPEGGLAFDLEAMVGAAAQSTPRSPDDALIDRLRDPRWTERARAIDEVVAKGAAIAPRLIERLGTDVPARMGICLALARLQAPEAASALLMVATGEATTQDERDVQAVALKALAHSLTGAEEGIAGPLLPLTRSPDPFVRAGAVICLGRLADRVGARVAALLLANDPHVEVKKAAAIAVSESVREDHVELVLPLLATLSGLPPPPPEGVEAILIALSRVEIVEPALRIRVRHRARRLVFGTTAAQRRLAITVLERLYGGDDPPPVWVTDDVLSRLNDPAADVRLIAASFTSRFLEAGHTDAVRRIEDAMERGERGVSLLLCDALVRHDTPLALAALEAAAQHDVDDAVKEHAAMRVTSFQPRSTEWAPLRDALVNAAAPAPASSPDGPAASPPPPPTTSRRVRQAASDADVVIAKDGDPA